MKDKNKNILIGVLIAIIIILIIGIIIVAVVRDKDDDREERINTTTDNTTTTETTTTNSNIITSDEALQKVLDDTKLRKEDLYDLDIERDYKYNKDVYEINFKHDKYEYEYYIDITDGRIVHSFKEID